MLHAARSLYAALAVPLFAATIASRAVPAAAAAAIAAETTAATTTQEAFASLAKLTEQVRAAETAFAKTLADRDLAAFRRLLATDAVFVQDPPLRGPEAIVEGWRGFFDGAAAPFSWAPDTIAVLDSGRLALSSGPVLAPDGQRIGTFNSVWRRERDGHWRIVLDHGCPRCNCPPAASTH